MTRPTRVLIVDDSAEDAELETIELRRAGFTTLARRVGGRAELTRLDDLVPDVVLLDYAIPGLPGEESLAIVRSRWPRTPVIFVTGTIGEDHAVQLIQAGATDYVLKERLDRLGPAVRRALAGVVATRQSAASDRRRVQVERARATAERATAARSLAELELERVRLEAALERMSTERALNSSMQDPLTGALRREIGWQALQHDIERAQRVSNRFVLAFVDIDGLKARNDREGHAAGDRVLQTLVTTLRCNLRSFDTIVRFGGDEFLCGLDGAEVADVIGRFERIRRSTLEAHDIDFSVGFAALTANETLDELMARADVAMYEAKNQRRDSASALCAVGAR